MPLATRDRRPGPKDSLGPSGRSQHHGPTDTPLRPDVCLRSSHITPKVPLDARHSDASLHLCLENEDMNQGTDGIPGVPVPQDVAAAAVLSEAIYRYVELGDVRAGHAIEQLQACMPVHPGLADVQWERQGPQL